MVVVLVVAVVVVVVLVVIVVVFVVSISVSVYLREKSQLCLVDDSILTGPFLARTPDRGFSAGSLKTLSFTISL